MSPQEPNLAQNLENLPKLKKIEFLSLFRYVIQKIPDLNI